MTTGPHVDGFATYRVVVAGHLDDHWADWLGDVGLTRNEDGTTSVTVDVADQSQLHGLLVGIRDIGATLLSVHQIARTAPDDVDHVLDRDLHTEHLTLRPATAGDADATWAYRRLDSVNAWLTGVPDTAEAYRTVFTEPTRLSTTVVVELQGDGVRGSRVVGDVMLRRDDSWAQAELGWVLDPAATGRGYATEAVQELLRYCFEDLGVHRVVARCLLDNDTSWRLMERVGMRREGHALAESLHRSGRWLDTVSYAVLREEWSRLSESNRRPTHDEPLTGAVGS